MASHPVSIDREARFDAAAIKGHHYKPALDTAGRAAIKCACKHDKEVEPMRPFDF